jgi:hypothetical protein
MYRYIIVLFATIGIILALPLCTSAQSKEWNWKHHKEEIIDLAKKSLVSNIETSLPRQQFAQWFRALMGKDAKLRWRITDCGWELSADGNRDGTMCVVVDAQLGYDFGTTVYLQVGTFSGGISGHNALVRSVRVSSEGEPSEMRTKLSELPAAIDLVMSK